MNLTHINAQVDFLDVAGSMLEKYESIDLGAPGLLEMTCGNQHGMATASGLNDYDYQTLSTLSMGHKQLNQLQTLNKIPIPPEILEHFKHIKCHCMMGLFPEIGRAWLTIDSEIYIWTYEQSRDVAYYDGLSHLIISVGLVKPKSGVFISDIKYLLILTTPVEIIVLGVTFGDRTKFISSPIRNVQNTTTFEEMQLMSKPIFVLSTDNVSINVVVGSENGRIFLGGRDGCLYEITYQAESSWFGKRCKKVNHSQSIVSYIVPSFLKENDPIVRISIDSSRELLYVLTEKGSIEAWEMGQDCNTMRRISKITQNDISQSAANIIKTVDPVIFKSVKSICPLSVDDSQNLSLLAITHCGVRLFFSTKPLTALLCTSANQMHLNQSQMPFAHNLPTKTGTPSAMGATVTSPLSQQVSWVETKKHQGLYMLHVRLPPGYTPNTTINKPKQVHSAHFNEGTLLMVSTPQQDQDILWSISSAPFPHRPYLTECTTVIPLDGIVWSLAEIPDQSKANIQSILRKAQKPKRIVLLTNQGAHIISLLKPVDILQQLLVACHGPHHDAVKAFFQAQGEREACATSLLLACSEQYRGTDVAIWAAQAFLLYGGEPMISNQMQMFGNLPAQHSYIKSNTIGIDQRRSPQMFLPTITSSTVNNGAISRTLQNAHFNTSLQNSPQPISSIYNQSLYNGSAVASINDMNTIIYSSKHDGIYIYVARLLRPVWKIRCVDENMNNKLSHIDCTFILEDLYALKSFLDANSVSDLSCTIRSVNNKTTPDGYGVVLQNTTNMHIKDPQTSAVDQAQTEEKRSLTALNQFIKHTCEVIALWKILCEHQFDLLAKQLTKEQQAVLLSCTFRDLILSRSETCELLIVALINSYLKDNASVSTISTKLRDECPNLYRHEDAVSFKATEILLNTKNCTLIEEKQEKLRTALQLCKDAGPNLPLQNICQQFTLSGFYEGVVDLTSTCAAKTDPEEFGIHFYQSDEPEEDREGYAAYAARLNCYKEVKLMMDHVYQSVCNANANQEFSQQFCNKQETSVNDQIMTIVRFAIQIKDPILHICVYEWLMAHDMLSELLSLKEQTLSEFLRRNVVRNPHNLNLIDLLWKYYEKNGHHAQAARILDNLASTQGDDIPLEQRIEYLARAVMCMRNDGVGYSITNGVLLKELEDKLEIARVQKTVLDAVTALAPSNNEALIASVKLNKHLYDITQLYENFADPFDLWECKLTILNCSHHDDPLLIESIWGQIINKCIADSTSIQEKCTKLFSKIENLFKEFGETGHCFPLAFIIRELEIKACQLHLTEGIVPEKLVNMNVDVELLMEYYSRMISINERIWANEGNEWHLVQSSIHVIKQLVNNGHAVWSRSKRRIFGKAQDMVSMCLNLCYQKPGTESMQQSLKEMQFRLQRNLV